MKKIIYLLVLISTFSCGDKTTQIENIETDNLTEKQIDSILTDFNFDYNNPIFIDSTSQVILPITTQFQDSRKRISKKSYSSGSYPRYWNILFYNSDSGETNLLTESKMRISDFDVNLRNVGKILSKSILYKICISDFNNDHKLDYNDPKYLFISNINGKNLRQISPKNENLVSYSIIPNSDLLIIRTKRDSNENVEFDRDDELIWYKIDLKLNSKPSEIIDSIQRKKIKNLYFEQWLRKK